MSDKYIVVQGNPIDGYTFVGTFANQQEAIAAGDVVNTEWWVAPLMTYCFECLQTDCDEHAGEGPPSDVCLQTLNAAITEVCDGDLEDEISDAYRRRLSEQGYGSSDDEEED